MRMGRQTVVCALWCSLLMCSSGVSAFAQATSHGRNYDEAQVRPYTLPDPLVTHDGQRIGAASDWLAKRRPEVLRDFRDLMYGHTPDLPVRVRGEVTAVREDAVGGLAIRKLVTLTLFEDPAAPVIHLMLYLPRGAQEPVPVFLGLSFYGNASIEPDPAIPLPQGWVRPAQRVEWSTTGRTSRCVASRAAVGRWS